MEIFGSLLFIVLFNRDKGNAMEKLSFEEVCKMRDGWWWLWLYDEQRYPGGKLVHQESKENDSQSSQAAHKAMHKK